jgi:hypothetical protein
MISIKIEVSGENSIKFDEGLERFIRQTPRLIKTEYAKEGSLSKSGRLYRRKKGVGFRTFHRASAKGETFATDSGKFLKSLRERFPSNLETVVESNINYAGYVENLRPTAERIVLNLIPKFKQVLQKELNR